MGLYLDNVSTLYTLAFVDDQDIYDLPISNNQKIK